MAPWPGSLVSKIVKQESISDTCPSGTLSGVTGSLVALSALFSGSVEFHKCHFRSTKLQLARVEGTLLFDNCTFDSPPHFFKVHVTEGVIFRECTFLTGMRILGEVAVDGTLEMSHCRLGGPCTIDGLSTTYLQIRFTHLESLEVSSSMSTRIQTVEFTNNPEIRRMMLNGIEGLEHISIAASEGGILSLRALGFRTGAHGITIEDAQFGAIHISTLSLSSDCHLTIQRAGADRCHIENTIFPPRTTIRVEDCSVSSLLSLKGNTYEKPLTHELEFYARVYLTRTIAGAIELDETLYSSLKNRTTPGYLIDPADRQASIHTLRLLNKMFLINHQYDWQDTCFYWLKELEWAQRVERAPNSVIRFLVNGARWVGGRCCGWGVRLRYLLVGCICTIAVYTLLYALVMVADGSFAFSFQGQMISGPIAPAALSVLTFLGGFTAITTGAIGGFAVIGTSEHVAGVLFLVLLTGMLFRKLTR
jgi:hypothetical protein